MTANWHFIDIILSRIISVTIPSRGSPSRGSTVRNAASASGIALRALAPQSECEVHFSASGVLTMTSQFLVQFFTCRCGGKRSALSNPSICKKVLNADASALFNRSLSVSRRQVWECRNRVHPVCVKLGFLSMEIAMRSCESCRDRLQNPAGRKVAAVRDATASRPTRPAGNIVSIPRDGVLLERFVFGSRAGVGIALVVLMSGLSATLTFSCTVNQ